MFRVLPRDASFARAIRISTLPTRLSSLASGVSTLDMMITEDIPLGHDSSNWKIDWNAQRMSMKERIYIAIYFKHLV